MPFLYPAFGKPKIKNPLLHKAFDKWIQQGNHHYQIATEIQNCDYVLIPNDYRFRKYHQKRFAVLLDLAHEHQKPCMLFHNGDRDVEIDSEHLIVVATSLYRTFTAKYKRTSIAMPAFCPDLTEESNVSHKDKNRMPTIGFCGWSETKRPKVYMAMLARNLYIDAISLIKGNSFLARKKGLYYRAKCIDILQNSSKVRTNFLIRDRFFSSQWGVNTLSERELLSLMREQYVDNIVSSDYTLCTKGNGNYSIRFYETLSAGRIPLFVDTDCVLPLEGVIDYKSLMPLVKFTDIALLPEKVLDFHSRLSDEHFCEKQRECRQIWNEYLSPHGFLSNLCAALSKRLHLHANASSYWGDT